MPYNTFSNSDHVSLNASCSIQWQYILFNKQQTNDGKTHMQLSTRTWYIKTIKSEKRSTHKLYRNTSSITHKLKMSLSAWSPFIHLFYLNVTNLFFCFFSFFKSWAMTYILNIKGSSEVTLVIPYSKARLLQSCRFWPFSIFTSCSKGSWSSL